MGKQKHSENKLVQKTSLNNIKYANLKHLHINTNTFTYIFFEEVGSPGNTQRLRLAVWNLSPFGDGKGKNKTYLGWHGFQTTTGLNSAGIELMSYIWLSINRLRLMTLASRPFSFATNIALIKDLLSSCIARA